MYVVNENLLCSKCGYRLKGLQDPGDCPDCGNRFHTARNIGVKQFKRTNQRLTGTNVLVAIITGMISIIFVPCTAFGWFIHSKNAALHKPPILTTFFALLLVGTCLVSTGLALREFWLMTKANKTPDE